MIFSKICFYYNGNQIPWKLISSKCCFLPLGINFRLEAFLSMGVKLLGIWTAPVLNSYKSCFIPMGINFLWEQIFFPMYPTFLRVVPMGIKPLGNQIPRKSNPLRRNFLCEWFYSHGNYIPLESNPQGIKSLTSESCFISPRNWISWL